MSTRKQQLISNISKAKIDEIVSKATEMSNYEYPVSVMPGPNGTNKLVVDSHLLVGAEDKMTHEHLKFSYSEANGDPESDINLNMKISRLKWVNQNGDKVNYSAILGASEMPLHEIMKLVRVAGEIFKAARGEMMNQLMLTPGIETLEIPFTGPMLYSAVQDFTTFRHSAEDYARILVNKSGISSADERARMLNKNILEVEDDKAGAALFDILSMVGIERTIEYCKEYAKVVEKGINTSSNGVLKTSTVKPVVVPESAVDIYSQVGTTNQPDQGRARALRI